MSSQIVERELYGMYRQLRDQGCLAEAALLDIEVFDAKGDLSRLVMIRDAWADRLESGQARNPC